MQECARQGQNNEEDAVADDEEEREDAQAALETIREQQLDEGQPDAQ